jgi:NAD(P)H-dependent flavin oxidoreductase YrpB (nitropropane dioxygenase family)
LVSRTQEIVGSVTRAAETWEVRRYGVVMPTPHVTGDLESISLWAGQSCSLVRDIKPSGHIVRDTVREAEEVIDRLARIRTVPQPV